MKTHLRTFPPAHGDNQHGLVHSRPGCITNNSVARHDRTELKTEARISLVTGTRWSEGEELKKVSSRNTKSLTPTLKAEKTAPFPSAKSFMTICLMTEKAGYLVIAMGRSALLCSALLCSALLCSALERMGIELPARQLTHVLRHTFASHFIMNGGNILVLQRVLGHTDIKMTMRYAHFSPDHHEDAVRLNPLNKTSAVME
ncbi:tyrosine-type recombinase/integrase [Serratia marcescens]|nr:tyrosine-type recombinase/integrase [Serratia marcescens]